MFQIVEPVFPRMSIVSSYFTFHQGGLVLWHFWHFLGKPAKAKRLGSKILQKKRVGHNLTRHVRTGKTGTRLVTRIYRPHSIRDTNPPELEVIQRSSPSGTQVSDNNAGPLYLCRTQKGEAVETIDTCGFINRPL